MTWGLIGGAAVGSIVNVGGSLIGGHQAPSGNFRSSNLVPALQLEASYRPIDQSSLLSTLAAQAGFGAGVDPDALGIDLLTRQMESASNSSNARKWQRRVQGLQGRLLQLSLKPGDRGLTEKIQHELNAINKELRYRGIGNVAISDDGKLRVQLADTGLQQVLDTARTQGEEIRTNRLTAERNLARLAADFPMAGAEDLDKLTGEVRTSMDREIMERFQKDRDRVLQQANTQGYNPAAIIGELERNRSDASFDTQFTAADRAFQILSGRQGLAQNSISGLNLGLAPDRDIAIMNAIRGQQTPTTGQLATAQLAATTAAGRDNQTGTAIANAGGAAGDAITLASFLYDQNRRDADRRAEADRNRQSQGPGTSMGAR